MHHIVMAGRTPCTPKMSSPNIQSALVLIEAYLAVKRAELRRGPRL